jgi:hypothetical protein
MQPSLTDASEVSCSSGTIQCETRNGRAMTLVADPMSLRDEHSQTLRAQMVVLRATAGTETQPMS